MTKRTRSHSTARDYPRTARLNRLFQEILAEELELIDDDRLHMVTVMSVDCEADLRRATVYYDSLGGVDDDDAVLQALDESRSRLQGAIGRQTRVKRTPELVFKPDDVARGAARLEEVLRNLREEDGRGAERSDDPTNDLPGDEA
jgi:ribosome-binding factor A